MEKYINKSTTQGIALQFATAVAVNSRGAEQRNSRTQSVNSLFYALHKTLFPHANCEWGERVYAR